MVSRDVLVGNDRTFYWGQLTSVFYDGDLLLHDDVLANDNPALVKAEILVRVHRDGLLLNKFPFGIALVDGLYVGPVVSLMRLLDRPRLDWPVVAAMKLGTLFKVLLLLAVLGFLISDVFPELSASSCGIVVASASIGSPLFYYGFQKYAMSHLNSGLFAVLVVYLCHRWLRGPTYAAAVGLGLAFGALAITHWQNGLYGLFVGVVLGVGLLGAEAERRAAMVRTGLCGAAAAGLVVLVQIVALYLQFDSVFRASHGETFFGLSSPAIGQFLFSPYHGLLTWSPIFGVGFAGLLAELLGKRRDRPHVALGALLTIAATVWLDASVADWWSGTSYGQRRASVLLPLFALGLAEVVSRLRKAPLRWGMLALTCAWAVLTLSLFRSGVDDLAVLVAGRPSQVNLEDRTDEPRYDLDREELREDLGGFVRKLGVDLICPFGEWPCSPAERALAVSLLVALALSIFALWPRHRAFADYLKRFGNAASALFAAYTLIFALALTFAAGGVGGTVGRNWWRFLIGRITSEVAQSRGVPAAPTYFMDALAAHCSGRDRAASRLLRKLADERMPPPGPEELEEVCRAEDPTFLQRVLKARARGLVKRSGRPAAGSPTPPPHRSAARASRRGAS